jgi:hypothetical protein
MQDLLNYNTHTTQQQQKINKHTLHCESYPLQPEKRKGGGLHVPWRPVLTSSAFLTRAPINRAAAAATAAAGPARRPPRPARSAAPSHRRAAPTLWCSGRAPTPRARGCCVGSGEWEGRRSMRDSRALQPPSAAGKRAAAARAPSSGGGARRSARPEPRWPR